MEDFIVLTKNLFTNRPCRPGLLATHDVDDDPFSRKPTNADTLAGNKRTFLSKNVAPASDCISKECKHNKISKYGVTVNIKPSKRIRYVPTQYRGMDNKKTRSVSKRWENYEPHKQEQILRRMRWDIAHVLLPYTLHEVRYETCPSTKMIHMHMTVEMCECCIQPMLDYWEQYSGNDAKTITPWRICLIKEIFDQAGWDNYIRKNSK